MSNTLPQVFNFDSHQVRVIPESIDSPLFVAVDVARVLGYKRPSDAYRKCKGAAKHRTLDTSGGGQKLRVIGEPDLYRLIFGSNLKSAVEFQDWVYEEVLPQIRKTGGFQLEQQNESDLKLLSDGRKMLDKGVKKIVALKKRRGIPLTHQDMWGLIHLKSGMVKVDEATAEQISTALAYVEEVYEGILMEPEVTHKIKVSDDQRKEIVNRLGRLARLFNPLSDQFSDVSGVMRALRGLDPRVGQPRDDYAKILEN